MKYVLYNLIYLNFQNIFNPSHIRAEIESQISMLNCGTSP